MILPKYRLAAAALLSVSSAAFAHDLWLQPQQFAVEAGAPVPVTVLVGHGSDRTRWRGDASRVLMLKSVAPDGEEVDLRSRFRAGTGPVDLVESFASPGIYSLALRTNHAVSVLPGPRFEAYLKEEGLDPILAGRVRAGAQRSPGREIYSRRARALIAVGQGSGRKDGQALQALGFDLEIVPERNPFALGEQRDLPVHVVFNGQRLPGALVQFIDLARDTKPVSTARTDASGRASFAIPRRGQWLLNVVWSKPITGDRRADYETIFSSLTFGSD